MTPTNASTLNSRFVAYLSMVAVVAAAAVALGGWLEYDGVNAVVEGNVRNGVALLLSGMALTAAAFLGLFSAWVFCRRESKLYERFLQFPDYPWRWRDDWQAGRIDSNHSFPLTLTAVALLWTILSIVLGLLSPTDWAWDRAPDAALVIPALPVVGILLFGLASAQLYRWFRFGRSTLHLETSPIRPGETLSGVVETGIPSAVRSGTFRVSLSCRRMTQPDVRHSRTRREVTLWRDSAAFRACVSHENGGCLAIPFAIQVPTDVPASSVRNLSDRTVWEVSTEAVTPGFGSYRARFEVPVFPAPADAVAETNPVSTVYRPERVDLRDAGMEIAPGVEVASEPELITVKLRRGRERRLAAILVQFAVLWAVVVAVVAREEIHIAVPVFLGVFVLIPLSEAMRLLLVERTIEASRSSLRLVRRVGGFSRVHTVDPASIDEIVVTAVSDVGMRERFRLAARLRDGAAVSLAERLPDQLSAQWIGLQVGAALGLNRRVAFRGNVDAAPPRGPIRRERQSAQRSEAAA